MRKLIRLTGILLSWGIAYGLFHLCFFRWAPNICRHIPASDIKYFLDALVYVGIAWLGGIGIPLTIGIWGTVASCVATAE